MFSQVPVHRWGCEGIPVPVRAQLFQMGASASCCVICGLRGHGVYYCPRLHTAEGKELWAAWDKKWLLLTGQELIRYALCSDDAEYRRQAAALSSRQAVDCQAVRAFRREHRIKQSARGCTLYQPPPPAASTQAPNVSVAPRAAKKKRTQKTQKKSKKANADLPFDGMHVDADTEAACIMAVDSSASAEVVVPSPKGKGRVSAERNDTAPRQIETGKAVQSLKNQAKQNANGRNAEQPKISPKRAVEPPNDKPVPKPVVQALRTSRGTKPMTPPPTSSFSSSWTSSSSSSPPRARQPDNALLPPLLPSPKSSFRPIQVPNNPGEVLQIVGPDAGRRSRDEQPSGSKSSRSLSSSAPVPTGKTGRTEEDVCVPPAGARGEVPIGSAALVVVSQSQASSSSSTSSRRPYEQWTVARYLVANHNGRKLFWERASDHKRTEVALELSHLPERHEVFQEARLDFNAEKWGLCVGAASPIDIDDDDNDDDDSDHGVI